MNGQLCYVAAAPFEAACRIPTLPRGHPSHGLHGHSFMARARACVEPGWGGFAGAEAATLQAALAAAVAPLDYSDLNARLAVPTDENLARWLRGRLDEVPGIGTIGIQSSAHQGVDLDLGATADVPVAADHAHIWRRFRFEAAHQLPNVPPGHQCGRMHGHGFEVILHADQDLRGRSGERRGADMGLDLEHLAACWLPLQQQLDHACMNDIDGLENPTSEMLARWIWQRLRPQLAELSWVTVYETATAGCHYDGKHFRIWKEQRFESALRLERAPEGDPRRRLHGHSYLLRLHLTAPLDELRGWTVDYGDVKALFTPLYQRLDHQLLNAIDGLADADSGSLASWLRGQCESLLPQLDRIDVYQTPGCGAVLSWGEHGPALPL